MGAMVGVWSSLFCLSPFSVVVAHGFAVVISFVFSKVAAKNDPREKEKMKIWNMELYAKLVTPICCKIPMEQNKRL
jgi:hypothetical protein